MTGLILKDILVIKKTILYMVVMILLFGGVYSSMDNDYFLTFFVSIMMVSILISCFSYDEFYHWDRYAAILPLSRRRIVGAKYLAALLMLAGGMLLTLAVQLVVSTVRGRGLTGEDLLAMSIAPLIGLVGIAVILPCCYRFGVQRSRMVMMALYGIPCALLVITLKFFPDLLTQGEFSFSLPGFVLALLILVIAVLGLSFLVSVRVLEKKELK